jgi:hypothetical protein
MPVGTMKEKRTRKSANDPVHDTALAKPNPVITFNVATFQVLADLILQPRN